LHFIIAAVGGSFTKQMTLNVDLDLSKIDTDILQMLNICAKFHENETLFFRYHDEHNELMSLQANSPSSMPAHSPPHNQHA